MGVGDKVYPDASGPKPPVGAYYSVKDQALPGPATYRGRSRGRSSCCCCFIWLCSILATITVILGFAVLIFWLVVQPRAPKYQVDNVRIDGLDFTSNTLTTVTTFQVMARNPNKKIGIYYDRIHVKVETDGLNLGEGDLPTFYQGHKNTTYIDGTLNSGVLQIDQATQTVLLAAQNEGKVPLDLHVDVKARVKIGSWKSRKFTVKVRCDIDLDVRRTSGSQVVSKRCKVKR